MNLCDDAVGGKTTKTWMLHGTTRARPIRSGDAAIKTAACCSVPGSSFPYGGGQRRVQHGLTGKTRRRVGIVRRQVNQRPLVRETENPLVRAHRDARIRTDAVDFPGQEQRLVVAGVA